MSLADQQWCPTSVQVTVLQARGLRIKGKGGTNDAYAIMQVAKEKYQTSVAEKSVAPVWKEEASFDLPQLLQPGTERTTLRVHVLHRALVGPDKLLGQAVINLKELSDNRTRNKSEWFKLLDKTGKADKDRGEVLVDIQFLRNNMTASMFDLSAAGKSRSRLGKFKDKVRGKKKELDTMSNVMPSFSQVLTDSEEEGNENAEVAAGKEEKKKKKKIKSLFSPKSNLQRNMSQSMSVLPAKNTSMSGSQSSGLNMDFSEGKKRFKFKIHKRSDSRDSSSGVPAEQSNLCINGSHVYCEEPPPRTSRVGSNFSLASSGHGSMEDVPESSPPSVEPLQAVRQYSPWTEEEEEETAEVEKEDVDELKREEEERMRRRKEEERAREQEEAERLAEEERRREEQERWRIEEEKKQREEEERIRMEEEKAQEERRRQEEERRFAEEKRRLEEERRIEEEKSRKAEEERREREERERKEEEERARREKEEQERLAEEKRRMAEEERRIQEEERQREEEERIRMEEERAEEERRWRQEEEEARKQEAERKLAEEKKRMEEEERRIQKEEERQREEEERIRMEEERRRQEEEEKEEARKQEAERKLAEEKKRMEEEERRIQEEEERQREEEERIRMEEQRAEEERRRKEEEEKARKEEKERELAEEKRRLEEEEKARREEERRCREEEEKVRRQEELEEKRRVEEQVRRQRQEEERIRIEEERRRQEEDKEEARKQEVERKLAEEKKRMEEEERRIQEEEERQREEEERIKREEEEERARKEREEYERLQEEKRKLEEEEQKRIDEEKKKKEDKEEKLKKRQREEKEKHELLMAEEKTRQLQKETRAEREKHGGAASTNPFDETFSNNPFEESHNSLSGPNEKKQQRSPSSGSLRGSKPASTDEKDVITAQREKRPAPQPPGERRSEREQDRSAQHLVQMNKPNKDKDVRTASVPPQRSVQMIAPMSRSVTDVNTQSLTQSSTSKEATNVFKSGKRPAPTRPSSGAKTDSETKQERVVYGLNPFEDDEEETELTVQSDAPTTSSAQWPPAVSQAADIDAASQAKLKSSKKARAPLLPANTSSTSINQNTEGNSVPDKNVTEPDSSVTQHCDLKHTPESPRERSEPAVVPTAKEEARGKKEAPPTPSRRLLPVKPLNSLRQQSVSATQEEKEHRSAVLVCEDQEKTKGDETAPKGPFSQLSRQELISLVLKQETLLLQRDVKITELEQYIDNLLVRVIEEQPSILMSLKSKPV